MGVHFFGWLWPPAKVGRNSELKYFSCQLFWKKKKSIFTPLIGGETSSKCRSCEKWLLRPHKIEKNSDLLLILSPCVDMSEIAGNTSKNWAKN